MGRPAPISFVHSHLSHIQMPPRKGKGRGKIIVKAPSPDPSIPLAESGYHAKGRVPASTSAPRTTRSGSQGTSVLVQPGESLLICSITIWCNVVERIVLPVQAAFPRRDPLATTQNTATFAALDSPSFP